MWTEGHPEALVFRVVRTMLQAIFAVRNLAGSSELPGVQGATQRPLIHEEPQVLETDGSRKGMPTLRARPCP